MNKNELLTNLLSHTNAVTKKQAEAVLEALATTTAEAVAAGEEVALPGIGKLKLAHKAARTARNPKTGEQVQVPAKTKLKFVPTKALKELAA